MQTGSPVTTPALQGHALPADLVVDGRAEWHALLDKGIWGLAMTKPCYILQYSQDKGRRAGQLAPGEGSTPLLDTLKQAEGPTVYIAQEDVTATSCRHAQGQAP